MKHITIFAEKNSTMTALRIRTWAFAVLATVATAALASCGEKEEEAKTTYTLKFKENEAVVILGEKYYSSLRCSENGGTFRIYSLISNELEVSFTSSNNAIASVNERGVVSGNGNGKAFIVAESKLHDCRDTLYVTVEAMTAEEAAFHNASWNWTSFGNGAVYGHASMNLFETVQSISIIKYPESKYTSDITYNSGDACVITGTAAQAAGATIAINGSFFNTTTLVSSTTFWYNGKLQSTASDSEATNRSTGIVAFKDGKIYFDSYAASKISTWEGKYDTFISAGPLLRLNNYTQNFATRDFNTLRHPRSMIGVTEDRTIIMVVVDGRFTGKAAGMTIPEMATIAEYLDMTDAINLDGGGSSTLWTSGAGVLNYPCDNSKWDHAGCRKVPTVIIAK